MVMRWYNKVFLYETKTTIMGSEKERSENSNGMQSDGLVVNVSYLHDDVLSYASVSSSCGLVLVT